MDKYQRMPSLYLLQQACCPNHNHEQDHPAGPFNFASHVAMRTRSPAAAPQIVPLPLLYSAPLLITVFSRSVMLHKLVYLLT